MHNLMLYNKNEITPRDLFGKILNLKNNIEATSLFFYLYEYDSKNSKYQFQNLKKEKNKKLYHFRLSFDLRVVHKLAVTENIDKFFLELDSGYKQSNCYYGCRNNPFNKLSTHFSLNEEKSINAYNDSAILLELKIGTELLDKDNIFELLQLYSNFMKINDMSQIKFFKTLFFENITSKVFDPYLDQLANENKIVIEKSKTGAVKNIKINKANQTDLEKHLNKLKQNGAIKTLRNVGHYFTFELNDFKPIESLKLNFEYKDNELTLMFTDKDFSYFIKIIEELDEYDNLIKKLQNKIDIAFPKIEELLDLEILNKEELSIELDGFILKIKCKYN